LQSPRDREISHISEFQVEEEGIRIIGTDVVVVVGVEALAVVMFDTITMILVVLEEEATGKLATTELVDMGRVLWWSIWQLSKSD
jgi:hypothetical protein